MSLARLAIAGLLALALVFAATAASVLLLDHEQTRALSTRAAEGAQLVRAAYQRDAASHRALLAHVCKRDLLVERLALELAAGGSAEADATRDELGLGRLLGSEVWLLQQAGTTVRRLGAAGTTAPPAVETLSEATSRPVLFGSSGSAQSSLLQACTRKGGDAVLWVVRSEPLSALRARVQPASAGITVVEVAAGSEPLEHGALAVSVAAREGGSATELWVQANDTGGRFVPMILAPLVLLASVFAALIAYFSVARKQLDDSVLVELEQAAERVAMGDLSSRIGRRSGGRADQTFQTFDRMTEELREMRTRLAEAERATAWQDMARRIAHEIKNPLSPIQMAMETLRKAHAKRLPEFDEIFDESTRAILDEVRRMERIVREFSEFARLPKPLPGLLELGALVADTVALYRPDDVRVEVDVMAAPIEVRVDREQITQVVVNLLHNALDAARATDEPHVVVRVELRTERATRAALVHVDDNGSGVPGVDRERVFEPYYTTKTQGTGLGLAIARRIALDHEGAVLVTSSPLGGARFSLRLPLASSAS